MTTWMDELGTAAVSAPEEPVAVQSQPNGLAIAGFVCALVGLLTCGLLSPLALLLSLIALLKPPRGFAVAGTVLGSIGSVWLSLFGFALLLGILGLRVAADAASSMAPLSQAAAKIEEHESQHGALPNQDEGQALIESMTDKWGNRLRYEVKGKKYTITSSGKDGKFGTSDDIRFQPGKQRRPPGFDDLEDLFD